MTTYRHVLEARSSLPRREYLEDRIQQSIKKIASLRVKRARCVKEIDQQIKDAEREGMDNRALLALYSMSPASLDLYARAEDLPEIEGVYAVYLHNQPIYIGESINIQKRVFSHLAQRKKYKCTEMSGEDNFCSLYEAMAATPSKDVSFGVLELMPGASKAERLKAEGKHINVAISNHAGLFNKTWTGKPKPEIQESVLTVQDEIDQDRIQNIAGRIVISKDRAIGLRQVLSDEIFSRTFFVDGE